jgi:hypothetical protein
VPGSETRVIPVQDKCCCAQRHKPAPSTTQPVLVDTDYPCLKATFVYTNHPQERMNSLNKWLGLGNLVDDARPEGGGTGSHRVTSFMLAINERPENEDEDRSNATTFVRVISQGKLAGSALALKQGQQVLVEGRLRINSKREGERRLYDPFILADRIQFFNTIPNAVR